MTVRQRYHIRRPVGGGGGFLGGLGEPPGWATPPQEVQNIEEVRSRIGPNLEPNARESFFIFGEGKIALSHMCLFKMLGILWGIQACMQNMKFFVTPDLPHPAPPT